MRKIIISLTICLSLVILASCTKCKSCKKAGDFTSETYSWETKQTDNLKLTQDYQNKDFIKDGIGEVTPVRYVDGDTTVFKTKNGTEFTVRYNGINTPESTYRIEEWGYAASKYNKQRYKEELEKGTKIVLQTEDMKTRLDSTGQRYLAWIWFISSDGNSRLFNLELAELGYAFVKSASGTQYEKAFIDAIFDISIYKLRIYGEKDPDYDYSNTAKEVTIKQIKEQYGTPEAVENNITQGFSPQLIKISGIVVRNNGQTNAYIQQYDADTNQYYGIYVYGGYNSISKLIKGAKVQITGKVGYYYGSLQITDVTSDSSIKVYTFNSSEDINIIKTTAEEINNINNYYNIGNLVQIENLKVLSYNNSDNTSATTLYCEYVDSNNQTQQINIRIDQNVSLIDPVTNKQIIGGEYFKGKTFKSITGIVSYYNGNTEEFKYANGRIQLALTSMDDVVFE